MRGRHDTTRLHSEAVNNGDDIGEPISVEQSTLHVTVMVENSQNFCDLLVEPDENVNQISRDSH
jgi:hypothetical protein